MSYSYPDIDDMHVCSCDGILCFIFNGSFLLLWNPFIRRQLHLFPPMKKLGQTDFYSFEYDDFTHTYKIVSVSLFKDDTNVVRVFTLGINSWKRIQASPYCNFILRSGVFVSGTINWLILDAMNKFSREIVSLDFEKESYQNILMPNVEKDFCHTLGVLRDCLCIFSTSHVLVDVWITKEYGTKKPWTKLYSVPFSRDWGMYPSANALYVREDDQVIMYFQNIKKLKVVTPRFPNN